MIQKKGNLLEQSDADAICIPTSGFLKGNGAAVLGFGAAFQASKCWPELPFHIGASIRGLGNTPHIVTEQNGDQISLDNIILPYHIVSFPIKPVMGEVEAGRRNIIPDYRWREEDRSLNSSLGITKTFYVEEVPGWMVMADLGLIEESCKILTAMTDIKGWEFVALPKLVSYSEEQESWESIENLLELLLDSRFCLIF